jgi:tripeptide aminopeptidase
VSGENVKPIIHRNYDGSIIKFPLDSDLTIDPKEVPELQIAVGENIITASGDTLLGADDKAGIAEIMAALSAFKKFPELPHGEIRICFNPDEEVGGGMAKVKTEKLGKYCYTIDGGKPGELETECFDAYMASYKFKGLNVHPGYAKDKMINAVNIVGRYLADLPEYEAPEHTSGREGFFHPMEVNGNTELCTFRMIIRDFQNSRNLKRIDFLKKLNDTYEIRYSGLKIEMEIKHQYENMLEVLNKYPEVEGKARQALEMTGLTLSKTAIRGGTDGSRLCQMGIPTPNLFAGGILIHSKKEFILESSLWKSAETIIHLAELWTN